MEMIQILLIILGVIFCAVFAIPFKWWINDLRVTSVERKIIICEAKIESARTFLEEYVDTGTQYANGTRKFRDLNVLKKQEIEKEKLKLQLLEHKLKKINPPMFFADEGL